MILTADNYYSLEANRYYYSVSQIKTFLDCPARAMAELDGSYEREKTDSLLVGGYVDAYFAGEMDSFLAENPQIYTARGELRAQYQNANAIIERIQSQPLAAMMLSGEKQKIVTGEIASLPFKAKLDVLLDAETCASILAAFPGMSDLLFADGAIVDLKVMKDFAPLYKEEQGRINWIQYWQYDLQMAVYQRLVEQGTGKKLPCYILAATKEKVPNVELFHIPQREMDIALELMLDKLPAIDAIKRGQVEPERCERCDYCKQTKVLTGATWFDDYE